MTLRALYDSFGGVVLQQFMRPTSSTGLTCSDLGMQTTPHSRSCTGEPTLAPVFMRRTPRGVPTSAAAVEHPCSLDHLQDKKNLLCRERLDQLERAWWEEEAELSAGPTERGGGGHYSDAEADAGSTSWQVLHIHHCLKGPSLCPLLLNTSPCPGSLRHNNLQASACFLQNPEQ